MDLKTARRARRRDQYRTPKVVSALSAFRNGVKDLELSQRQYRAQSIEETAKIEVIHRIIVDPEPKVIEGGELEVIDVAGGHEPGQITTQTATQSAEE